MQRIGIFGGSFNPIHSGHIGVALKAAVEHSLDKVIVVPAACNPFKNGCGADALRWTLVKFACAPYPVLEPWDFELRRGGVSYSIDTVRTVKGMYPEAELFFIIGEDNVADIPKWKESDELVRLVRFVTFPRTPESSTEVRLRLAEGQSISDIVPQIVADFLEAKGVVFDFSWVKTLSCETFSLMKDLKNAGKKIAILSNMSVDFYNRLFVSQCAEFRSLVDVEVISGFEKLTKPEKPIYDLTAARLCLKPQDLLFLDDTEVNVTAARKWGWRSHIYSAN